MHLLEFNVLNIFLTKYVKFNYDIIRHNQLKKSIRRKYNSKKVCYTC